MMEIRNSCHVGEKTYLCHVCGGFSPKGHGILKNKETRCQKNIAILREPSVSSAGNGKLVKEKWVRGLTGGKKSGWEVCGSQRQ